MQPEKVQWLHLLFQFTHQKKFHKLKSSWLQLVLSSGNLIRRQGKFSLTFQITVIYQRKRIKLNIKNISQNVLTEINGNDMINKLCEIHRVSHKQMAL